MITANGQERTFGARKVDNAVASAPRIVDGDAVVGVGEYKVIHEPRTPDVHRPRLLRGHRHIRPHTQRSVG